MYIYWMYSRAVPQCVQVWRDSLTMTYCGFCGILFVA